MQVKKLNGIYTEIETLPSGGITYKKINGKNNKIRRTRTDFTPDAPKRKETI